MRFMWNIASKNLTRNKLRSSISIAAIAISVCMVVIVRGLLTGMLDSMTALNIQYNSGHIRIVDAEYLQKERLLSLSHPVDGFEGEGVQAMADELQGIEGVDAVLQRLKFAAASSSGDKLVGMLGWGVNPEAEMAYTDIKEQLVEGRMVEGDTMEVVLGAGILEQLHKSVGDKITLFYTTSFGSFKGSTFTIVGKIDSGLKLLDSTVLYMSMEQAQRLLEMPDQVTDLLIFTKDYRKVKPALNEVKSLFAAKDPDERYRVLPWYKANSMIEMMQIAEKIYNVIYVLLILLASFVIINTMIMIVKERTREIGMMTALGLESRSILLLFVMEGTVMGIVGSAIGVVLGGIATKVLSVVGIDYSKALADMGEELIMKPIIYTTFSLENIIFCFVLGVIVTAITCIIPARRAARLEPTEALRAI